MALHKREPELRGSARAGFTLVELLISLTIGLLVVAAALSFAISTFQGTEGNRLREEVYRNGRFVNMSLSRDLQAAGVGIESEIEWGSLRVFNDTLVILSVPWQPSLAHAHEIVASSTPPVGQGTCGALCIDLEYDPDGGFDLAVGDLARLQVNTERRLIIITDVTDVGTRFQVEFLADTVLLDYPAAFQGNLQLEPAQTTVQELNAVVYYEDGGVLYRSQSFDSTGAIEPSPMAYGLDAWDVELIFTDLDQAANADPYDADVTNDFDDMLGVDIDAVLGTNQANIHVADGGAFTRDYEWRIMPRNLMYERNR